MIKRILLVTLIFLLMIAVPASAEITYTSNTKTEIYESGDGYTTVFASTMFAQNSDGVWVDAYEVLSMTKSQDDITFHYDGIDGQYSITFEAGVIYNGNYFSFSEVKQSNPEIEFNFPVTQTAVGYKYAVNITNLDELNTALIENITLTYKSHEGFQLSNLKSGRKGFKIKSTMGIYFDDLIKIHPLKINMAEKRIYISNITDNIVNGQLYLDPTLILQDPDTENLEDAAVTSGGNANFNYGISTESEVGRVGTGREKYVYTKFNNLIPVNADILTAFLNYRVTADLSFSGDIFVYGVTNQTWKEGTGDNLDCTDPVACEGGIKFSGKPIITTDILDTFSDPDANEWISLNVTTWVINQFGASNNNISFYVNTSSVAENERIVIQMKENSTNSTVRPFLNISFRSNVVFGLNISVFSAVDGSSIIDNWNINVSNGSTQFVSFNNNNPTDINTSDLPTGANVNVTISKIGYVNATYDVPIDGSHLENLTALIFTVARGLINIEEPANSTSSAGLSVTVNITSPDSITGDINSIFYELNASGNWISLCTSCSGFSGSINLGGFGTQDLLVRAASTVYGHNFAQSQFTNLFAVYDVLIMDELRNITFDMSLVDFANFTAFCPDTELEFDITSNFTEQINIGCEFNYLQLDMKLLNQTDVHFRTLIPDFDVTTVTFHMIDNITLDPEDNFIDVKLILDDLTGNFRNGIVHIKKALNGSIVDIIDQQVDAESSILAYLVIGERYILSIESADGTITKSLGTLFIRDATESEKRIRITDLGLFPDLQDFVSWTFTSNTTEGFINFTYNDTLDQTSTITFFIFNATDPANLVLLFSNTTVGSSDVFFTWPDATLGNTYLARFVAVHTSFGELQQDVVFIFSERLFPLSIFEQDTRWYTIAALIVIMMTALLFGARVAAFGVVVVSIEAAFFTIIGWLDITNPGVLISLISLVMLLAVLSWIGLRRREQ